MLGLAVASGCDDLPDAEDAGCRYADECGTRGTSDELCAFEDDECVVTLVCEVGEGPDTWRGESAECEDLDYVECNGVREEAFPGGTGCPFPGQRCHVGTPPKGCAVVQRCGDDHRWGDVETQC